MFFSKKSPHDTGCMVVHLVVTAVMLLLVFASLIGVYMAHVRPGGLVFGDSHASLAIVAFVVAVKGFYHSLKACFGECEVCSR